MAGFINIRIPLMLRSAITMIPAIVILAVGLNPTNVLVLTRPSSSSPLSGRSESLVMLTSRCYVMGIHVNLLTKIRLEQSSPSSASSTSFRSTNSSS